MKWLDKLLKKDNSNEKIKEPSNEEVRRNVLELEKQEATKNGKPWVAVLDTQINADDIRNGFFELDWNDEFVNMLQQSGYQGQSEEEIVDRWFQTLCRTIGNEQGIDVTGSGYVQINRRDDGKTEVS